LVSKKVLFEKENTDYKYSNSYIRKKIIKNI